MKFKLLISLMLCAVVLAGCSSTTPSTKTSTTDSAKTKSTVQVDVKMFNDDNTALVTKKVTTTKKELNGINGCFMYKNICYVKSPDPKHNGAYVPEGIGMGDMTEASEKIKKIILDTEKKKAEEANVFDVAKKSKNQFLYVVSSPSLTKTQMLLKGGFVDFSLEYNWGDWGQMYYVDTDLTASGGAPFDSFDMLNTYDFCAGGYFCDIDKKEGKGFQMQIWSAKYSGAKKDPNFFQKNGETLVKKTDKFIITYKSYKGGKGFDIPKYVAKLFESFKIVK